MSGDADKTEKKQRGRPFPKGVSGNPKGCERGSRHKATLIAQALLDGEAEGLARKVVDMALGGDVACLRTCIERLIPVRKDAPVKMKLPKIETAGDVVAAMGALLSSVGKGEVTPGEAQAVAGLFEAMRKDLELLEIERRIAALEEKAER